MGSIFPIYSFYKFESYMNGANYSDDQLDKKIEVLKSSIQKLAEEHEVWHDCVLKSYLEHYDSEPLSDPCLLVICDGGIISHKLGYHGFEFVDAFDTLLESLGYYSEMDKGGLHIHIRDNDDLKMAFYELQVWRWVCHLVGPNYSDIYGEIYEYLSRNPNRIQDLHHRKFESLIDGVMRNMGFRTELGPGQADGGIDLRLYTNDIFGEQVTLVQIKRNNPNNPIRLQAVQALTAIVDIEAASRGLFVTASRYLPSVREFAPRLRNKLVLADSKDVGNWLKLAHDKINQQSNDYERIYENSLHARNNLASLFPKGKIYHARWGYNTIRNKFALAIYEGNSASIFLSLRSKIVSGNLMRGEEIPLLQRVERSQFEKGIFRARRKQRDFGEYFWGDLELYTIWDGKPQFFDHLD